MPDTVWTRALNGDISILRGAPMPTAPTRPHRAVHIDCGSWERPLGPILELRDQLDELVEGTRTPLFGAGRVVRADTALENNLAYTINRLQRQLDHPLVIVLEAFEAADAATLELVSHLLGGPTDLLAGAVLQCSGDKLPAAVEKVIDEILEKHGREALIEPSSPPPAKAAPQALGTPELTFDVRRVLRAAAAVGDTFEVDLVAALLGLDPFTALELLQLAIDEGIELEDRGKGIFRLPPALGDQLRGQTTPSLAQAWHAELAAMMRLAEAPADTSELGPSPTDDVAQKLRARDLSSRAAEHAEAAGHREDAAMRYLDAAEEAATVGGHARALELAERALHLLPAAPITEEERRTRVRALLTHGRVLWLAAGNDEHTSLGEALRILGEARHLSKPSDRAELRAEVNAQIARVAYDIGDADRLRIALDVLSEAQRLLLDAGQPFEAAKLLNDEAAVLIRLGDLARAAETLARSRDMFMRHAEDSDEAKRELAQTNHLVARLPLHGTQLPGDEAAVAFAVQCGQSAERAYAELDDRRERARVHETLGRLARLEGRSAEARKLLQAAYQSQCELADAIGLARTTGALTEVLADAGEHESALTVLDDSITLNLQVGSRQGVAYNLRDLDDLERALGDGAAPLEKAISDMRQRCATHAPRR